MSEVDLAKSWEEFCDMLRDAGRQVLDAAPDDDFDRAEGLRYVSRLAGNFVRANLEEADPARAILNQSGVKIGLDNPDYAYGGARLSPRFDYRLRGRLNDAPLHPHGGVQRRPGHTRRADPRQLPDYRKTWR